MLRIARTATSSSAAAAARQVASRPSSASAPSLSPLLLRASAASRSCLLRSFASPSSPRPPLPPTSRRDPFLNQPRGPRILPPGAAGDAENDSGQKQSKNDAEFENSKQKLKIATGLVALISAAVVLEALWRWWGKKQATEAELLESSEDARAELAYRGFPLELLTALRAAKEVARKGEQEASAAQQRCAEEMERLNPSTAHRYARVAPGFDVFTDPSPDAAKQQAKALSTDAPARMLLARQTPSLLEAERLLRLVLAQHLAFSGLDLKRVAELAEVGAPPAANPNQRKQKAESPAAAAGRAAAREAAHRELDQLMTCTAAGAPSIHEAAGIKVDKAVLPYVLSLLAHTLQLQARVVQERANVEEANANAGNAAPVPAASASSSSSSSATPSIPLHVSLSSAAARKYRESEQSYLQSLALYRHHLNQDPRPLAVGVLRGLGGLYLDAGRADRAEAVWMRAMEMLAGSRRSLETWQASAAGAQALPARSDAAPTFLNRDSTRIQDPAWLQAHSRMSSELAASLAELHRSHGDYTRSIQWTQEALREWDRYWTERTAGNLPAGVHASEAADPTATEMHVVDAATTATTRNAAAAAAAAALSQEHRNQLIALDSLPRAMHLLSALAHDLHEQSGSTGSGSGSGSSGSSASKKDEALTTGVQALQALERIVALSAQVRHDTEAIAAASAMEAAVSSQQQQQQQQHAYAPFLDPAFVRQVHRMLLVSEAPKKPSASKAAAAAARAAAGITSTTEPEVRAEACAAYSNLAMMLAAAGTSKEGDATAAREIAVHVCPKPSFADA